MSCRIPVRHETPAGARALAVQEARATLCSQPVLLPPLVLANDPTELATSAGLPPFVKDEFDTFLECGILADGFLRLRCDDCCHHEHCVVRSRLGDIVGERDTQAPAFSAGAVLASPESTRTESAVETMERLNGIEPSDEALEAAVLPLNYTRGGADSSVQPMRKRPQKRPASAPGGGPWQARSAQLQPGIL